MQSAHVIGSDEGASAKGLNAYGNEVCKVALLGLGMRVLNAGYCVQSIVRSL